MKTVFTLYAIQNDMGKWFNRMGSCWHDDKKKAHIYTERKDAKKQIAVLTKFYPEVKAPTLVRLVISRVEFEG